MCLVPPRPPVWVGSAGGAHPERPRQNTPECKASPSPHLEKLLLLDILDFTVPLSEPVCPLLLHPAGNKERWHRSIIAPPNQPHPTSGTQCWASHDRRSSVDARALPATLASAEVPRGPSKTVCRWQGHCRTVSHLFISSTLRCRRASMSSGSRLSSACSWASRAASTSVAALNTCCSMAACTTCCIAPTRLGTNLHYRRCTQASSGKLKGVSSADVGPSRARSLARSGCAALAPAAQKNTQHAMPAVVQAGESSGRAWMWALSFIAGVDFFERAGPCTHRATQSRGACAGRRIRRGGTQLCTPLHKLSHRIDRRCV